VHPGGAACEQEAINPIVVDMTQQHPGRTEATPHHPPVGQAMPAITRSSGSARGHGAGQGCSARKRS
jgi:hypothetical protein